MTESEIKSAMRALNVPQRQEDYWDSFPQQVLNQVRRVQAERAPELTLAQRFGWSVTFALSCFAACFCLWQAYSGPVSHVITKEKREIRHALLQFHNNVGKVMRDEHGLRRLVEEVQ